MLTAPTHCKELPKHAKCIVLQSRSPNRSKFPQKQHEKLTNLDMPNSEQNFVWARSCAFPNTRQKCMPLKYSASPRDWWSSSVEDSAPPGWHAKDSPAAHDTWSWWLPAPTGGRSTTVGVPCSRTADRGSCCSPV